MSELRAEHALDLGPRFKLLSDARRGSAREDWLNWSFLTGWIQAVQTLQQVEMDSQLGAALAALGGLSLAVGMADPFSGAGARHFMWLDLGRVCAVLREQPWVRRESRREAQPLPLKTREPGQRGVWLRRFLAEVRGESDDEVSLDPHQSAVKGAVVEGV